MAAGILKREYDAIKSMQGLLDGMSRRLEVGETLGPESLDSVAESFQEFAACFPHAVDEPLAFTAAEDAGAISATSSPAEPLEAYVDRASYRSVSSALSPECRDKISIVIAMLNEEEGLPELLTECRKYAAELIGVDGHSKDHTAEIAAKAGAKVLYDNGRGKGDALRVAIPHIRGEITIFMDADWSHDPADIPKLIQPILSGEADHVTGSRLLGGSSELHGGFDEFMRLTGSSLITACIGWRFHKRISDSQNGFRAIRTEVLRSLDLREDITTIEQEMIIKTLKKGYRLAEVPTHEYRRRFKESHIVLRRVWFKYVSSMLKYLFS